MTKGIKYYADHNMDYEIGDLYRIRGEIYFSFNEEKYYPKAIKDYTSAIKNGFDDSWNTHMAYLSRALCYSYMGDEEKSGSDYKKADEVYKKYIGN